MTVKKILISIGQYIQPDNGFGRVRRQKNIIYQRSVLKDRASHRRLSSRRDLFTRISKTSNNTYEMKILLASVFLLCISVGKQQISVSFTVCFVSLVGFWGVGSVCSSLTLRVKQKVKAFIAFHFLITLGSFFTFIQSSKCCYSLVASHSLHLFVSCQVRRGWGAPPKSRLDRSLWIDLQLVFHCR